jgi:hypothetical protein
MPSAAELRESAEQFTSRSMQQVRELTSRGIRSVQHRFNAFSDSCRGRKNENADNQHWSTSSLSERNSQNRDSSKDPHQSEWELKKLLKLFTRPFFNFHSLVDAASFGSFMRFVCGFFMFLCLTL